MLLQISRGVQGKRGGFYRACLWVTLVVRHRRREWRLPLSWWRANERTNESEET